MYANDKLPYDELKLFKGKNNKLESKTGGVSYESFLKAYQKNKNEYRALQRHPRKWDKNSFKEFKKVIGFLKKENVIFILPYEYYLTFKKFCKLIQISQIITS